MGVHRIMKIFFVDLDGTLCFKEASQKGAKLVPFEMVSVNGERILQRDTGVECFGRSYISMSNLTKLRSLKNLGVLNVGITARHEDCVRLISEQVLELFDCIYYYCEARKANIVDGKIVPDYTYNKEWLRNQPKANFSENLDRLHTLKTLYPKVEVLGSNDPNAPAVYLNVENLTKKEIKAVMEIFNDYPYCSYYKQSSIIEIRFIHLSKWQAISNHLKNPTELTVCAGDSVDDLDMLSICDLGIFPKSLIEKTTLNHNFITSGLLANKVVSIEDKYWRNSMLDEVVSYFTK